MKKLKSWQDVFKLHDYTGTESMPEEEGIGNIISEVTTAFAQCLSEKSQDLDTAWEYLRLIHKMDWILYKQKNKH